MSACDGKKCDDSESSSSGFCATITRDSDACSYDLQNEKTTLLQQKAAVTDHLKQLEQKVKQLQQNAIQQEDKNRALSQKSLDVLEEIKQIERQNKELYDKSLNLKAGVNKYCQLGHHLKEALIDERDKVEELKKYICKCKKENQQQLCDKQRELDHAKAEKRKHKKKIAHLEECLDSSRKSNCEKKSECKDVLTQKAGVEAELCYVNRAIAGLKEDIDDKKEELVCICEEYKHSMSQHQKIEEQLACQEQERQHAFGRFFDLESKVQAVEKQIEEMTTEKNELICKNEEAGTQCSSLVKCIAEKEEKLEELEKELAELRAKQACIKKKIAKAEKVLNHLVVTNGGDKGLCARDCN